MTAERPSSAHPSSGESDGGGAPRGVQFVKFSFYQLRDESRVAPQEERLAIAKGLGSLLARSAERMLTRLYSTVGTRADTDFLVWQVADELPTITGLARGAARLAAGGAAGAPTLVPLDDDALRLRQPAARGRGQA